MFDGTESFHVSGEDHKKKQCHGWIAPAMTRKRVLK
jgi:hypothetical protein